MAATPRSTSPEPGADQPDPDATGRASLKERRRVTGRRRGPATPSPETLSALELAAITGPAGERRPGVPEAEAPTTVTAAMRRPSGLPVLHPLERRMLPVVESGGHVPSGILKDYVVSHFDATEQITPNGCRTPITRKLWSSGQHVRRDIMDAYLVQHPELVVPEHVVELPEDPSETTPEDPEGAVPQDAEGAVPDGGHDPWDTEDGEPDPEAPPIV